MNSHFYREGLARVAKIIHSNPNYDEILGGKLLMPEYAYFDQLPSPEARKKYAIELFLKKLKKHKTKQFDVPLGTKLLGWANSKNNQREIEFFSQVSRKHQFDLDPILLGDCPRQTAPLQEQALRDQLIKDMQAYYQSEEKVSKSLIYQHVQYSLAYLNFHATLSQANGVRLILVANDHSPIPVALSMVAKGRGVQRLYVQHAEVTPIFPALDFDFSILRNKQSQLTYEGVGALEGRLQIMHRKGTTFDKGRLVSNITSFKSGSKIEVVIYLTAIFTREKLAALVSGFQSNPKVGKVLVKLHPSAAQHVRDSLTDLGIELSDNVPNTNHLAIVGSSSVVTELLHVGIPVFQCFELDTISEDYYGFVRQGIVGRISIADASGEFWQSLVFNEAWLAAYAVYDPTADDDEYRLAKFNEADFLTDVFYTVQGDDGSDYGLKKRSIDFRRNLFLFTTTFLALLGARQELSYADDFCIAELEQLFNARDPDLNRLLGNIDFSRCESATAAWLQSKKIEWNGYVPTAAELRRVFDFVLSYQGDKKVAGKLEGILYTVLIRLQSFDLMRQFWQRAHHAKKEKLHINRRIALMRLLAEHGDALNIGIDKETLFAGLSKFHRLKLRVQSGQVRGETGELLTHPVLEQRFVELAPATVSRDFVDYVLPCYTKYRSAMHYMDVKTSEAEYTQAHELIVSKLRTQTPFSLIRLSDGEGYIFRDKGRFFSHSDAKNRERHWWGEEIPDDLREELGIALRRAVANADLLGIPSIYRFIRDHTDSTTSLAQSVTGRGLLEVLNGLLELPLINTVFSEDKINLSLFSTKEKINRIARNANRVVFVGSAVKESIKQVFDPDIAFVYIGIPTHFKTKNNDKYTGFTRPLPYQYKVILKEIDAVVGKGDVVFVAGGIAGKCFINRAKEKGAVALDVGSALDELIDAGIHSLH